MSYYPSLAYYADRYDRMKREYAFCAETREDFSAWKELARARLGEISGLNLCLHADDAPRLLASDRVLGIVRETMLLQTEPGVVMPFWLFRPEAPNGCAILLPHGHGGGKEGNLRLETDGKPFIRLLTDAGYTVLCPDARGAGERREFPQQGEEPEKARLNSHRELSHILLSLGGGLIGTMVWDLMRLADYALGTLGMKKLGCAGMSGGGQQALWLAALDERIAATITSGYFYGVKESLLMLPHNCDCNYVPFFYRTMDMGDLAALAAPRALFVESGRDDPLNGAPGLANVYPQMETAKRAYALLGANARIEHHIHEGGHQWNGLGMLDFLRRNLLEAAE